MRQLIGMEKDETMQEERLDAEGNIVEEEEEEEKNEENEDEDENEEEEEPKVAQLHAEWIHTLVRYGNHLFDDGSGTEAAVIFRHALFLYEMLEKGVVEPQMVAWAMRRLGRILSEAGDAEGGVEMFERSLGVYAELPNEDRNRMAQAEVLLELGGAHMQSASTLELARRAIMTCTLPGTTGEDPMAAFGCYRRCATMLEFVPEAKQPQGFRARLLARLADCFIVLGDAEAANHHYDRALALLTNSEGAGLVSENAHILCMLAIGRVRAGHPAKAIAVLETAYILLFHRSMDALRGCSGGQHDSRYLVATLLGLCYGRTGQPRKAVSWCSRALAFFEEYMGPDFRGLRHRADAWLLVHLLLSLGNARSEVGTVDEATIALERALEVVNIHLPGEEFLPCAILKGLADLRVLQSRHDEALITYSRAMTCVTDLRDPQGFAASFQQTALLQSLQDFANTQYEAEAEAVLRGSLRDELVAAAVALRFQMAIASLQRREHAQAVKLLTGAVTFYREAVGELRSEMTPVLGQMALSLHAAFLSQPDDFEAAEVDAAFRESLAIDFYPSLALKFAVFLSQEGQLSEAMDLCESVLLSRPEHHDIVYEDHEETTLPRMLFRELRGKDSTEFPALGFALFLLYTTSKRANFSPLMDDVSAWLWHLAAGGSCPMMCCLCGYVLMDYGMFTEATESFLKAGSLQNWSRSVTRDNVAVCLLCLLGPLLRLQAFAAAACRFAPAANCH